VCSQSATSSSNGLRTEGLLLDGAGTGASGNGLHGALALVEAHGWGFVPLGSHQGRQAHAKRALRHATGVGEGLARQEIKEFKASKPMNVHFRFNESNSVHTKATIFINGKNTGELCMSPDEADWLYLIIENGCEALSPIGLPPIKFVGSGCHRPDEPLGPPPSS
jgi:hypothetical protein